MPVLLLLLLCGCIAVWLISWSQREKPTPPEPYWAEQIGELSELGRYKHATAAQYASYATTADSEQDAAAAQLFRALSHSEQVHELCCAEAVRRLGGHYEPPLKVIIFRGRTADNLNRAYDTELRNYDRYRSGMVEHSVAAGNHYAARVVIRIAGSDLRQTDLLQHFIERSNNRSYAVCPVCGNLWTSGRCDHYCPFCHTPGVKFTRFEPSQHTL